MTDLRFWVTSDGRYAGQHEEGPTGSFVVAAPPSDLRERWTGTEWVKPIDQLRVVNIEGIGAAAEAILNAGAPVAGGLHVALDDGSRADLTAMVATATAAASGAVAWPDSYARGWITIENVRIPLVTPAAGLALAASVGNYYAAVVQHRRDLKDAALAAVDAAALDAIDISTGWPT